MIGPLRRIAAIKLVEALKQVKCIFCRWEFLNPIRRFAFPSIPLAACRISGSRRALGVASQYQDAAYDAEKSDSSTEC